VAGGSATVAVPLLVPAIALSVRFCHAGAQPGARSERDSGLGWESTKLLRR
jgi:hypothetical protein